MLTNANVLVAVRPTVNRGASPCRRCVSATVKAVMHKPDLVPIHEDSVGNIGAGTLPFERTGSGIRPHAVGYK